MTALAIVHARALLALPIVVAVLHRIRGGGILHVPGLSRLAWIGITSAAIALLCSLGGAAWPVAVALGLGYGLWCLPGWMAEITGAEGATVPADQIMGSGADVRLITLASFGHPLLAVYLRAAVYLVPGAAALVALADFGIAGRALDAAPLALVVVAFWPAYALGYRMRPTDQCSVAEPIVGAAWGAVAAGAVLLAA